MSKTPFRKGKPRINVQLHKTLGSSLPVATWKALLVRMMQLLVTELLTDTHGIDLPLQLGRLMVTKQKPFTNRTFIDWKRFGQTGEKHRQANRHTFGHFYTIAWLRLANTRLKNNRIWTFKAARSVNRTLAQKLFTGADYLPLPDNGSYTVYRN